MPFTLFGRRTLAVLCLAGSVSVGCWGQRVARSLGVLRDGDLLFRMADVANPITDVTSTDGHPAVDHVAIFFCRGGEPLVVEAVGRGVVVTPLDSLLRRSNWLVGRVRGRVDRRRSVANALTYVGRDYDTLFLPDNEAIYCSELVQLSFVSRRGRRLFAPVAMSFHDATGQITDYWRTFYGERGMEVPEGLPGTNPGEMSRRKNVRLRYVLPKNAKWK